MHAVRSRHFLSRAFLGLALASVLPQCTTAPAATPRGPTHFLLITADDLGCDSVGCFGSTVPDITPNIDALAADGMRFTKAHVNIAVCQPCRQSLMTGRYPHRNGALGFDPIAADVPTLQELLHEAGYLNGILGKERHLRPEARYCWDYQATEKDLASGAGIGRSPELYRQHAAAFFAQAKAAGKPFFLMANSHDPHRPFAGSDSELRAWGHDLPKVTRTVGQDEVDVPGFLPELPAVRQEVAEYFTSVHRCDQTVGAILDALRDSGLEQDTLVMFLSDNGMAVPFAKANCYLRSTQTPWIVRWPDRVAPGTVEEQHLISGIDFMPTVLAAAGLDQIEGLDGQSMLPLLAGQPQSGRDHVFTEFHRTSARRDFPMRCVQGQRFGYIYNAWANKTKPMRMDSTSGRTFRAMQDAAATDSDIAARVTLFEHRVPEEFYDFATDPNGLHNLIDDPRYADEIAEMRILLSARMQATGDPLLDAFTSEVPSSAKSHP